ncbi:hypothetical protein [Sulfurimonas sp.]|uniref:hypothetical protein n=1 Tax=Sulfurimonas sp. TaxID=2022749 RepID=UPI0025CCA48E|nr:hypothetical protein [Sulfurimonas sp.]MBW6489362.1 hypothetical protein [Sulfurimonas sp.]
MSSKKFIAFVGLLAFLIVGFVGVVNYVVDPYGLYGTKFFNLPKIKQSEKIRLIKVFKTQALKPVSISLGTSRTEYGYDPTHQYFIKPSYNLAVSSASMYEARLNFEWALKQGNLKKVLLVVDYIMFNKPNQKNVADFETYFDNPNIYKYLLSLDSFKDAILTLKGGENTSIYLANGQKEHNHNWQKIAKNGGHLATMQKDEKNYYKNYPTNYTYKDTKKLSFPDFENIVSHCYENNIELDIIFGPSHIRQWEALNYYLGYEKWLQWKKDVVFSVGNIAQKYHKKPFKIVDFSVYHSFTTEIVPTDPKSQMKYHWEASHYKNELGSIVLDRLNGGKENLDFGVELNLQNIDNHLEKLKQDRIKCINVEKYQEEVFLIPNL